MLFVTTGAGSQGPHEIAVVAPFGAALAARMLARPQSSGTRGESTPARRTRAAAYAAGLAVLLGYLGVWQHGVIQPAAPPDGSQVASWLEAHHLRYGLGGYWQSSIVTVDTGRPGQGQGGGGHNRHAAVPVAGQPSWYDPAAQRASFVVLDSTPGYLYWEPRAVIARVFGPSSTRYNVGPFPPSWCGTGPAVGQPDQVTLSCSTHTCRLPSGASRRVVRTRVQTRLGEPE